MFFFSKVCLRVICCRTENSCHEYSQTNVKESRHEIRRNRDIIQRRDAKYEDELLSTMPTAGACGRSLPPHRWRRAHNSATVELNPRPLQIKKDRIWIPISPLPNAFIINIGDILEIVTNGIYRSIEHRVTVNSEKERFSIAMFLSPNLDGELGPATPSLVTPERQ